MEKDNNTLVLGSWGQRIINYIIDMFIVGTVTALTAEYTDIIDLKTLDPFNIPPQMIYITYPCTFIYYFIFELFLGKTPGKLLSKTRVVNLEGDKPEIKELVIRSAVRLLDIFYIFSFVILMPRHIGGLHDLLSKTRVIDDRESGY